MNTVEHIVLCYFQHVRKCLTASDIKVEKGNNRQFDLLAASLKTKVRYHVEASVTHEINWCPTPELIEQSFTQKFFGVPRPKEGDNTDFAKEKSYLPQIKSTYAAFGMDFQSLRRVWCCWAVKGGDAADVAERLCKIAARHGVAKPRCEVLLLRDVVIPELTKAIGKSNYDDDVLRMLSLLEQAKHQTESGLVANRQKKGRSRAG